MTFAECLEKCRDGKGYSISHPNLVGFFYKAPYPPRPHDTDQDGAHSALTFWVQTKEDHFVRHSPVFLLDDFDRDDWTIVECLTHPSRL